MKYNYERGQISVFGLKVMRFYDIQVLEQSLRTKDYILKKTNVEAKFIETENST